MRLLLALFCLVAMAAPGIAAPRHVIVIAMENKDADSQDGSGSYIYGNMDGAPYINGELAAQAARADNYIDDSGASRSQPHYIEMIAGRTKFHDVQFKCDNDPKFSCGHAGQQNWSTSKGHLAAQLDAAQNPPLSWMTYQEGIDPATTGACPINSAGLYAVKHNPFVYFADVSGAPPDENNAYCIAHTRNLSQFAADMASNQLANFVFVTPDLCNDMHGALSCMDDKARHGDDFLKGFLPPVLDWARHNDAVVFVVWDEGRAGKSLPFFAAGAGVKQNYRSNVEYSHRSMLRTIERIFGLPALDAVKGATDFSDMFEPGALP